MSDILPHALRLIATALNQVAELIEARLANQRIVDEESSIQYTPGTTPSTATIANEFCEYCTHGNRRYVFDPNTKHCYFHLTRRELQERNLDRHSQVPRY